MSLLDGGLAGIIGDAFSSGDMQFLPATRYRLMTTYEAGGDSVIATTETDCLAMVDQAGEFTRANSGYTQNQQRILVLGTSLNPVQATLDDLTTDDQIEIHAGSYSGVRWDIKSVDLDPAGAILTAKGEQA